MFYVPFFSLQIEKKVRKEKCDLLSYFFPRDIERKVRDEKKRYDV